MTARSQAGRPDSSTPAWGKALSRVAQRTLCETDDSNRQQVTGALGRCPAPLVVNLGCRDVPLAEQVLHLADINAGIKQQIRAREDQPLVFGIFANWD